MRRFSCTQCSAEIHFDNTACLSCQSLLAYVPSSGGMVVLDSSGTVQGKPVACCANRGGIGCNWAVEDGHESGLCLSCRHTTMIPDLSIAGNELRWAKLEAAKRYLFYSLLRFGLPTETTLPSAQGGLEFHFLSDEFVPGEGVRRVLTGHDEGLITLNIAEADDATRETHRAAMGEPYRTLIGHFRHEIGHYYWDRLVAEGGQQAACRAMFGDEREDYGAALERHYQNGAPDGWEAFHVSAYATSHPWEDFAETWAHYLHITDGLETAAAYRYLPLAEAEAGLRGEGAAPYAPGADPNLMFETWIPLTVAVNAMNRSMGQPDFYPFVLSDTIRAKLAYIHALIHRYNTAA